MNITQNILSINPYSHDGRKLQCVKAIVLHWTANPMVSALNNRNYFESLKDQKTEKKTYGSAHYVVGLQGEIIQCVPDTDRAIHAAIPDFTDASRDPVSKKFYTDLARQKFGDYAINYQTNSPNNCTIGIEMCPIDANGNFNQVTLDSTSELVSSLLKKFSLTINDVITHNQIVGFKDCPKLFVDHPEKFEEFKEKIIV